MKTPITYYGGKQTMLKYIIPLIPNHDIYTESFVGGAAVFFAKKPSKIEVINDLNGELINFYTTIVKDFDALKSEIDCTLYSRLQYNHAVYIYNHPSEFTNVKRAWAIFVLSHLSYSSNFDATFGFNKSNNLLSISLKNSKQNFTIELKKRLENSTIECDDGLKIIKRYDTPKTFHFIDPPYINTNSAHYDGMFNNEDFEKLLNLCETLQGKFMLTMFKNDLMLEFATKNNWTIHKITRKISAAGKNIKRREQEEWMVCNYNDSNTILKLF